MLMRSFVILFLLIFPLLYLCAQYDTTEYAVMFYNVENLFDPRKDSLRNDDAFTPKGLNHWTWRKFNRKVSNLSKVILSANGWSPPDVIGVAEVENEFVLQQLCWNTGLKRYNYHYVHYDSPDSRGIDVALLYRKDRVKVVNSCPIPIVFPFEPKSRNRDVLYVCITTLQEDTLHFFVNHWTSRYGGYANTIEKRNYYAEVVKYWSDSLLTSTPQAHIVIMGDFNDYPTDESVLEILQAQPYREDNHLAPLNNLMYRFSKMRNVGTHKGNEFWGCLDQFIVSASLLDTKNDLQIIDRCVEIYCADFMVVPDEKYGGIKTFRTYLGPRYVGGFSDHLPILLRLKSYK